MWREGSQRRGGGSWFVPNGYDLQARLRANTISEGLEDCA